MILILFVLGCIIGSFLNVVIYRLPNNESIVFPPSACQNCGYRLKPYDNVPVLSYLILKGKCRKCSASVSLQYPIIEFFTGVIFGLVYLRIGLSVHLVIDLLLVSVLICIALIDVKHQIIPDELNLVLLLLAVIKMLVIKDVNVFSALYGALAGGGFLFLIALVGPMGGAAI